MNWPGTSAPVLHPATALLNQHVSASEDEFTTSFSEDAHLDNAKNNGRSNGATEGPHDGVLQAPALERNLSVKEADMQAFFPSKRQAPQEWGRSWGRRINSEEERKKEQWTLFTMLDDFENQPPFTIQRLAELILRPTEHHHTLPKYVSALKRLLSVTATRDAFPVHVGEEEDELGVESYGVESETLENGASTPHSSARARTTSVPGSPTTAPLFSPIPFLMKSGDEGLPGAGPTQGGPNQNRGAGTEGAISEKDIPSMELGGADRTTEEATENALRSGAGVSNASSVVEGDRLEEPLSDDRDKQSHPVVSTPVELERFSSQDGAGDENMYPALDKQNTGESAVANAGKLASDDSGTKSHEPLGVPPGPVDEVDQVGQNHGQLPPLEPGSVAGGAKAILSTTLNGESTDSNDTDAASLRAIKRVRSERDLGDV